MVNPLAPVFEWFLGFFLCLPTPVRAFCCLAFAFWVFRIIVGWFI